VYPAMQANAIKRARVVAMIKPPLAFD
jgi:hypothetical protein